MYTEGAECLLNLCLTLYRQQLQAHHQKVPDREGNAVSPQLRQPFPAIYRVLDFEPGTPPSLPAL